MPMSTAYEMRGDSGVIRNYGRLLVELAGVVPDGLVRKNISCCTHHCYPRAICLA